MLLFLTRPPETRTGVNPAFAQTPRCPKQNPIAPNVGIALFNASGQVLIGRRFRDDGPEIILPGLEWQMPQGGIDAGEDPREAVMRELWEETGADPAPIISAKPTG